MKVIVGHVRNGKIKSFCSVSDAQDFINTTLQDTAPTGVHRGDYYIDVLNTEHSVEEPKRGSKYSDLYGNRCF